MMKIIEGKKIAAKIIEEVRHQVQSFSVRPKIVDVVIGDNKIAKSYAGFKKRVAENAGLDFQILEIAQDKTQQEVEEIFEIIQYTSSNLRGLLVQLPLPDKYNSQKIRGKILPQFDIDVLAPLSQEKFYQNDFKFIPPTAEAIMEVLHSVEPALEGKQALIVGQGLLVGKPVSFLLKNAGCKIFCADSNTSIEEIKNFGKQSDIVISATGNAKLINDEFLKPGCVLIDAGSSEIDGSIFGDVDKGNTRLPKYLTPVPGGVGPVTIACLIRNAAKL